MTLLFRRKEETEPEPAGELEEIEKQILQLSLPSYVEKAAFRELKRLSKTNSSSAEYTIGINYLDYLLTLPWNKKTEDNLDLKHAESVLNGEHYGLKEIKDRILEYLAVRTLKMQQKQRILVVDDEKVTRQNLEHVLSREGYEVDTASRGDEAISMLKKEPYDVIVTDLRMEKVDGMDVLKHARNLDPSIEVIMITGYATVSTAIEALKKGSYYYLQKPLKLNELRSIVKKALEKKSICLAPRGPILGFVGPPGTGKTSLGKSIARSLGRKFVRISLAGMKDEAEIRGHRRSYVGALPGRIIQEIRRCESRNPVFMLDEIDKIGQDFRGDPASALLEVLDPEQNHQFVDHYLDIAFDLSEVMFITTANSADPIPAALLDRLEIITLTGYTEREKVNIAKLYLIPEEIEKSGLSRHPLVFQEDAVEMIVRDYTREAGLRNLQRNIAAICRKVAREILSEKAPRERTITPEIVREYLGPRKYYIEVAAVKDRVGISTGLAWTETGGEIVFIEATKMKGKNRLILTGSLGEVMKESAQAALSYIRSNPSIFHLSEDYFNQYDLHIHVPAGAIPKDGPSAGIAIAAALISLLTERPCHRDVALSGEVTLSGRILPVGGVKEKVLAAHRAGVKRVILPAKNNADIESIPEEVLQDVEIIQVNDLTDILDIVLKQ